MEITQLGRVAYLPAWHAMRDFTAERTESTQDRLWLCEHDAVFTQGVAGKAEHVLAPLGIPVVASDRGGQVTYHGRGQAIAYPLMDLRRAGLFVKVYVYRLEEAVIRTLMHFGVTGHRVAGAPGIYVRADDPFSHATLEQKTPGEKVVIPGSTRDPRPAIEPPPDPFTGLAKIAALGIKVSRHCTYHGVALNVAMDLEPFSRINPCGFAGLKTVDLSTIGVSTTLPEVQAVLARKLRAYLSPPAA